MEDNMPKIQHELENSLLFRVACGILAPLVLLTGIWVLYHYGNPFICFFHAVTGLYCPGCGSGRALYALVHGNILTAFRNNLFLLFALPFVGWYFSGRYLELVFHRSFIRVPVISLKTYQLIMTGILIYWIARNLPWFPFTLLAPVS